MRLLLAGAGIAAVIVVSVFLAACGGSGRETASPTPRVQATEPPSATPTPAAAEAPPPPNRQDCLAIRGTPFASPDEAAWYAANCARTDGPPLEPSSAQVLIGDTLIIPKAGVEAPVARATVPASAQMPDPVGYFNAVWYDFSTFDGYGGYVNAGNLVLSGHVDCARCINGGSGTAVFYGIRSLREGDTARYLTSAGQAVEYVVVSSYALSVNAEWGEIVASTSADMTLITCTGNFIGGEYDQRHVVALKKVVS